MGKSKVDDHQLPTDSLSEEDRLASEGAIALPATVQQSNRPVVVYEQAVMAIQACSTILEAKNWNNKAEALSAWARVYADDRVMREARSLKLYAYRQIGRLADQMRPNGYSTNGRGRAPGPASLLAEHGLLEGRANTILAISRMPENRFQEAVSRPTPPSPTGLAQRELRPNPQWSEFSNRLAIFLTTARKAKYADLVLSLDEKQTVSLKRQIKEAMDWLGELQEQIFKRFNETRQL